jgi:hypothetical protein
MSWDFLLLALLGAQQSQPMKVVFPGPLAEPLAATSWSCDFLDAAGKSFQLNGRFAEIPVGAQPDADRRTVVNGSTNSQFLGESFVRAGGATADIRSYTLRGNPVAGSDYTFNFKFLRNEGSYATISRYTPPTDDKHGVVVAFASGYCSSKFHAIGEKDVRQ